jgi:hypothetical protein
MVKPPAGPPPPEVPKGWKAHWDETYKAWWAHIILNIIPHHALISLEVL